MKNILLTALVTLLLFATAFTATEFDYNNMTDEDIIKLREERHEFYRLKSDGRQEAIIDEYLNNALKVDGNQADFDIRYYGLDIDLDFNSSSIDASVSYKIMPVVDNLNSVDLNLRNELTVDSIRVEGASAVYSHLSHLLTITLPTSYDTGEEFDMIVYYHGIPYYDGSAGMLFNTTMGYPMVWTKATPYRSRYWWPCKDYPLDKPDSIDIWVERPSTYDVATNGKIISDTDLGGGRKKVHYKHNYPICTYNVAMTCSEYDVDQQTWNYDSYSMPVYSWTLPTNIDSKDAYEAHALPVLTLLSDRFGIYPWVEEKCGNANFGWYGAMEHQSCNMYAVDFYTDWVIAHENGHQWWGDMITCRTFNHIWLNEGFASYCEPLYVEERFGVAAYHDYMATMSYMGLGTIYVNDLVYDSIYVSNTTYDKAAWVLHMLRGVTGDSSFFQGIRAYGDSQFKYGSAVTQDFVDEFSASYGENIGWFISQWIYGEAHPDYQISWECQPDTINGGYKLLYFIEQTQTTGTIFEMPIKTTFVTTGADLDTIIWNQYSSEFYEIAFTDSVTDISFDPDKWILRTVAEVPFTMHIATRFLPDGELNIPYNQKLLAVGGQPPYNWTFLGGDLPFGMTFDADTVGLISGTPTWSATYYFTIQVADSDIPQNIDIYNYALTVTEEQPDCGDADDSGGVDISDAVYLIAYIFGGGSAPDPLSVADVDCSGGIDISDAVYLIAFIFGGGPAPCAAC